MGSGDGMCARGASGVVRCGGEVHKQVRGGDGGGGGNGDGGGGNGSGAMVVRLHRVRAHAEACCTVAPHHFRLRQKNVHSLCKLVLVNKHIFLPQSWTNLGK